MNISSMKSGSDISNGNFSILFDFFIVSHCFFGENSVNYLQVPKRRNYE